MPIFISNFVFRRQPAQIILSKKVRRVSFVNEIEQNARKNSIGTNWKRPKMVYQSMYHKRWMNEWKGEIKIFWQLRYRDKVPNLTICPSHVLIFDKTNKETAYLVLHINNWEPKQPIFMKMDQWKPRPDCDTIGFRGSR